MPIPWRAWRQRCVLWAVWLLAAIVEIVSLSDFGVSRWPIDKYWGLIIPDMTDFVGMGLLCLTLATSLGLALRHRRAASRLLLLAMVIIAPLLSWRYNYYLAQADEQWRNPRAWWMIPYLAVTLYAPFVAAWALRRKKIWSAASFVAVALLGVAARWHADASWSAVWLAQWSAPFAALAGLWLWADARAWPSMLRPRQFSWPRRVAGFALAIVLWAAAGSFGMMYYFAMNSSSVLYGLCKGHGFTSKLGGGGQIYTAQILYVGRSRSLCFWEKTHGVRSEFEGVWGPDESLFGNWAIARVEENFQNAPVWPRYVLLTNDAYRKDERYLVFGDRERWGILTRWLSITYARGCTHLHTIAQQPEQVRALRSLTCSDEARILGSVSWLAASDRPWLWEFEKAIVGVRVVAQGVDGAHVTTTDGEGVYDMRGLKAGAYTIHIELPPGVSAGVNENYQRPSEAHVGMGEVEADHITLQMGGRVIVSVNDVNGNPVDGEVTLQRVDRAQSRERDLDSRFPEHGQYDFAGIAPGVYRVVFNANGPDKYSPYARQVYRCPGQASGDTLVTVHEGETLRDIKITAQQPKLVKRRVRVFWENGAPAADSGVCVAYEGGAAYDKEYCHDSVSTDANGWADAPIYDVGAVKVWAEEYAPTADGHHQSASVSLRTDATSKEITLQLHWRGAERE